LGLVFSSDTWAVLGLVFLGITFAAVILWLLARTLALRKIGFYGGIVSLVFCMTATFYAHFQRGRLLYGGEAVVMNLVAPVKSSPGAGSKDIFVLHEGTKVRMLGQLDGWTEIVLSDGNKGWISTGAIEAVVPDKGRGE
ncbi:MAG: SH3 domain-containing protein, partial [Rikenellaceae bacterium]|nr:SH3 domain-containing protein [Rikenellaceae bacterium]